MILFNQKNMRRNWFNYDSSIHVIDLFDGVTLFVLRFKHFIENKKKLGIFKTYNFNGSLMECCKNQFVSDYRKKCFFVINCIEKDEKNAICYK